MQAINAKIEATQKAQQRENEIKMAEAAAKIAEAEATGRANSVAIEAKTRAEANRVIAASLTPELVQYEALQKWNGELPRLVGGQGAVPFINVDTQSSAKPAK